MIERITVVTRNRQRLEGVTHLVNEVIGRSGALVPQEGRYHHLEGNAHAHIKACLVGNAVTLPIIDGRLALGRWQSVFMAEFDGPRDRALIVTVVPVARGVPSEGGIPEEFRKGFGS
jgi:thiamine phosphate synthase YjbQ (UPF0047 family)